MKRQVFVGLLLCLSTIGLSGQLRQPVEQFVAAHQQEIVREFVELLSIPNVAADRDNIRRNATLLGDLLRKRGFTAEILETGGNPLVFAELQVPGRATHAALLRALRRPAGRPERLEPGQPVHAGAAERAARRRREGHSEFPRAAAIPTRSTALRALGLG